MLCGSCTCDKWLAKVFPSEGDKLTAWYREHVRNSENHSQQLPLDETAK